MVNGGRFLNSANKSLKMAAPNRGLFNESFRATRTRVQVIYVIVTYTYIWAWATRGLGLQSVKFDVVRGVYHFHCSQQLKVWHNVCSGNYKQHVPY
jgi:hypothetical protein